MRGIWCHGDQELARLWPDECLDSAGCPRTRPHLRLCAARSGGERTPHTHPSPCPDALHAAALPPRARTSWVCSAEDPGTGRLKPRACSSAAWRFRWGALFGPRRRSWRIPGTRPRWTPTAWPRASWADRRGSTIAVWRRTARRRTCCLQALDQTFFGGLHVTRCALRLFFSSQTRAATCRGFHYGKSKEIWARETRALVTTFKS